VCSGASIVISFASLLLKIEKEEKIFLPPVEVLQTALCMKMRKYIREALFLKVLI
jgi:hypothetical protein